MNRFGFALIAGCLLAFAAHAQQVASPVAPLPVNRPRARQIDVQHIAIDLRFDWQKKQVYGNAAITLSPLHETNSIALDAGMLTIESVSLANGIPLVFSYDGGDKDGGLVITLDRPHASTEKITLKIVYHSNWVNETDPNNIWGSFGKGIRFFSPTSTEPNKRKQIWSVGEPGANRYWFPCYDYPNDWRTTDFTATIEKPLMVISNGELVAVTENNDGTRTFHWKTDKPYANHLTSFVAGEYADIAQESEGIPLHSYCYPQEKAATAASVARLPDMVSFFSRSTGIPYPFAVYAQAFVPDFAGWMSNRNLSVITENMVDDESTHADYRYLWDITEGEALAQQWFGNYVSCSDWSHYWLNKSFARYFSGLYNEYKNGRDEFLSYQLLPDHATYLADWQANIRQPVVNNRYETADAAVGSNYPYFHGASVLHMLRKYLGDEVWWKAIRLYLQSNAGKPVTTEDFRKAVEISSGEPMDWFFDQWLYTTGHPVFSITKKYEAAKKQLTINVVQTQPIDSAALFEQTRFFKGKMDIELDDTVVQVWLQPQMTNTFRFAWQQPPRLVNADFESTWIKEMVVEKSTVEWCYQLTGSKDILARMQAITELVKTAKNEQTTAGEKTLIYQAFRKVITGNAWWRLRATALSQLQNMLAGFSSVKPVALDKTTTGMLLRLIKNDTSWVKTGAIRFLGMTRNPVYASIYTEAFADPSARVNNAAAIALGKTKSPKAYQALVTLKDKPSWKSQSMISCLNGLKELGDPRGAAVALQLLPDAQSPHWTLATSVWDHRLAAAETLVALGQADKGYDIIQPQFTKSMQDGDINDIFYNVLQIVTLADARGAAIFPLLKTRFSEDANAMAAASQYEQQFNDAIKKKIK